MNGLIFRFNQIVIPPSFQNTVINAAHCLGHLGMTKTKQILREKYWFPDMNKMTEGLLRVAMNVNFLPNSTDTNL